VSLTSKCAIGYGSTGGKSSWANTDALQDPNKDTGQIERRKRLSSQSDSLSQYGQMLLNQGGIEQILLDYLSKMDRIAVEWNTKAETLTVSSGNGEGDDDFPVAVGVSKSASENDTATQTETIHARYVIACDGAQSWTRTQLEVPMESHSEHSTWGVVDIVPITDFRKHLTHLRECLPIDSCSRHSPVLRNSVPWSWQHYDSAAGKSPGPILHPGQGR
jgi:2-polyprenyl-6-methoxyphenol hydroxylase-like FAD-dependent oxidoreductase